MTHQLKTGGDRGYLRIATEEAFATREQIDVYMRMVKNGTADKGMVSLWGFYATSPSERATQIIERLLDLGEQRIRHMDETGIDKAVLALTAPGAQAILDLREAKQIAQRANDFLAEHVAARPDRYVGMTTVAPQDPEWSASEIIRGAKQLGFKGVQINSHTQGEYLDHPRFDPIFRALADTGQPLYIHPSPPPDSMIGPMLEAGSTARSSASAWKPACISCAWSPSAFSIVTHSCRSWSGIWARHCHSGFIASITCTRRASVRSAMSEISH